MSFLRSKSKSSDTDPEPDLDQNILGSTDTINAIVTDDQLDDLSPEYFNQINDMKKNPVFKIFIEIINKINTIKGDRHKINVTSIIDTFKDLNQIEEDKLNNYLQNSTSQVKELITNQELSYHLINPKIAAPVKFSEHPSIKTTSKYIDLLKCYPRNNARFTGERNSGPSLIEFIHIINELQERFVLSEQEFLARLLASTTKTAYTQLSFLIKQNDSVASIYDKMFALWDFSLNYDQARELLMTLKAKKTDTFSSIQSLVLQYSTIVGLACVNERDRQLMSNFEAISALPRCFPPKTNTLIRNQTRLLTGKLHRTPTYMELISFLNPYKPQIDIDISMNGIGSSNRDTKFPFSKPTNTEGPRFHSKVPFNKTNNAYKPNNIYRVQSLNTTVPVNNNNNKHNNNFRQQNRFVNSKKCLLCGGTNHTAAQTCYKMKLNNQTIANVSPTQKPCTICRKFNLNLYHPETYCFNKNKKST